MDEKYMRIALELAEKGRGSVSPNPMVGAVIVKNNQIIGQGYHEKYGHGHAEVNAFASAKEDVTGATIYVTLEPCSHFGKTPPCADLIIDKKIKKVVIGTLDPNPLVAGKGVERIKAAGIEVVTGVLEDECQKLNEVFMKYIQDKEPFVVLKTAMSLDGKIATSTGESRWISGEESRAEVHLLRGYLSGIMVGIGTVLKDDPQLTSRIPDSKNPVRVIVDSQLRIPLDAMVLKEQEKAPTIIATTHKADRSKLDDLKKRGVEVWRVDEKDGRVDLRKLVKQLGANGMDSILLEGGATLNYAALEAGIVDKVQMYIAPKIIGGDKAKTPVAGKGIGMLSEAFNIQKMTSRIVGEDLFVEGYIHK